MARPILSQELTFSGNASDQHCFAYFPNSMRGQYIEFTVYVQFSAAAAAGKVQIQTSFCPENETPLANLVWAAVGSTIDWGVGSSQKYASVTGVFDRLRLDIDTAVTSGTVRAFVVAASHPA